MFDKTFLCATVIKPESILTLKTVWQTWFVYMSTILKIPKQFLDLWMACHYNFSSVNSFDYDLKSHKNHFDSECNFRQHWLFVYLSKHVISQNIFNFFLMSCWCYNLQSASKPLMYVFRPKVVNFCHILDLRVKYV